MAARLAPYAFLVLVALVASELRAEPTVTIATPMGWSTRDPGNRARELVSTWTMHRADAQTRTVLTTGNPDDFAEVIAVIELDAPYDERNTELAELERAIDRMLPYEAGSAALEIVPPHEGAPAFVIGHWSQAELTYRVALVPTGRTRALVVLATLSSEAPLYERAFDDALAGLSGSAAPVRPFDHGRWRMFALVGWCLPAALLLALMLWRRPFGIQYAWIGRGLGLFLFTAAIVAAWIVNGRMEGRDGELRMAGISAETLTAETVTYGVAVAIVCWIVGAAMARRDLPVDSAPMTGAFAGRSSSSMSQVQIPVVMRVAKQARMRHPDGPSRLDPATDPPGGRLRAVDPGVEPRDVD